jgi:hypothetical protein
MPAGGRSSRNPTFDITGRITATEKCNARPIASTGLSVQALIDTADRFAKRQ